MTRIITLLVFLPILSFSQWQPNGATAGNIYYLNGKVGIGTNNPTANLEIAGDGVRSPRFSVANINNRINDSPWYGMGVTDFTGLSNDGTWRTVQLAGYYGVLLKTNYGQLALHENGKVGIGTTNPDWTLTVNGDIKSHGLITRDDGATDLWMYRDADVGDWSLLRSNKGNGIALIGQVDDVALAVSRATSNVLIGKTSQANTSYKLDIAGKVRANEIVVNSTGADYVFEQNYKLRGLGEVESFIKENNHLPGIPSAKEMQTNGIALSELNTKLLEKIEELTLHVIELSKDNEKLKDQNKHILEELEYLKGKDQ
ncbi:MAG: hypothetical protein MJA30_06155 [Cytophagales bacterium]|nr:hypothetical protein [Cytophagales bacterium]